MKQIFRRLLFRSAAPIVAACVGALVLVGPAAHSAAAAGPFADFSGSWSGQGTVQPQGGASEPIRCKADYQPLGAAAQQINLQLRCASDSYNFDLTGQFSADEKNHISGRWTEHTRNVGGTAVGNADGDSLQIHTETSTFSADVVLQTRNKKQTVTIDSHGGGQIVKASITLSRS